MGLTVPVRLIRLVRQVRAGEGTLPPAMSHYHFGKKSCSGFEIKGSWSLAWGLGAELEDMRRDSWWKAWKQTVLGLRRTSLRERRWKRRQGRRHTFLSVLHGVTGNGAVSRAGWGQPAEDHGSAASLLGNGAVRGCWNTCGTEIRVKCHFCRTRHLCQGWKSPRACDLTFTSYVSCDLAHQVVHLP